MAVGARRRRRNAFDLDAQPRPPHAQTAQTLDGAARERCAVVAANRAGQPVLPKNRLEHHPHLREIAGIHALAAEHAAAGIIDQGERLDARAVAAQEPALEVDRSDVVGLDRVRQRPAVWWCRAAFFPRPGEPFVTKIFADG